MGAATRWTAVLRAPGRRPARLLLTAVLLFAAPACLAQAPRLELRDGGLWLAGLPPILAEEPVERHLTSGLTTSLVVSLEIDGERVGGAQVDLRYELWDEVFLVHLLDTRGEAPRDDTVGSRSGLDRWWAELSLRLGPAPRPAGGDNDAEAELHLRVVPFSQDEETETRLWFAESVRRAEAAGSGDDGAVGGSGLERVLTTLIGTSIRRRSLVEYHWTVTVPRTGRPRRETPP